MNSYRIKGKFVSKEQFERTYGELKSSSGIDLTDPEIRQAIHDISHPTQGYPVYRGIHTLYYFVWLVGSSLAVFTSFWLGTLLYR